MMPWTHAVVAYVAFSLATHARSRTPPTTGETALVALGALFPDLVDKPLAWQFGVLAGGRTLAHSVFVAVPLSVAAVAVAARRGNPRLGLAVAAGYLLHLPGDLVPDYRRTGDIAVGTLLWPVTDGGGGQGESFAAKFLETVVPYVRDIATAVVSGEPSMEILALLAGWGLAVTLWVYDGMPVLLDGYRWLRRAFVRKQ